MKRRLIIFFSILFSVGIFISISLISRPIIKISHIECTLGEHSCPQKLNEKLNQIQNKSFLFSNIENLVENLDLDLYHLIEIKKTWPNSISLSFSKKTSGYILKLESTDEELLIADSGLVYSDETDNSLTRVRVSNWPDILVENKINQELHSLIIHILNLLNEHQLTISEIKIISSNQIFIYLDNGLVAIIQKADVNKQIAQLAIVINKLDLNQIDTNIKEIDLRFKFPVLRTHFTSPS